MSDLRRFSDGGGTDLERRLAESVREEAPSPHARGRTDVALGLAVGVTVKTPCFVAVPPNVVMRLATKRSKSWGAT